MSAAGTQPLRRRCPVCQDGRGRPAWHEGTRRYVRCSGCTVLFSDVGRDEYEAEQHNVWHDAELASDTVAFYGAARAHVHRKFLEAHPPTGAARLLDVGCGLGFFVERAIAAGWDGFGCDTSAEWVAHARERAGHGRIVIGQAEAVDVAPGYDLITAWDVLEHIFDPLPFLSGIARLLAPGGRLFIRTPNEAWVYPTYCVRRALLRERVELGALNHVVYYRATTIRRALGRCGLSPIAWPAFPPPQVGYANRRPTEAGRRTPITRAKNVHAWATRGLASASRGSAVLSADLDVLAVAAHESYRRRG